MRTDNDKITITGFISFMLVMIKAKLYEGTVALCASMDLGKRLVNMDGPRKRRANVYSKQLE